MSMSELAHRKIRLIAQDTLANIAPELQAKYPKRGYVELRLSTDELEYVILYGSTPLAAVLRSYVDDDSNLDYPQVYSLPTIPDCLPEEECE